VSFRQRFSEPNGYRSGAGFSLCGLDLARTKPHRLKPAPPKTSAGIFAFAVMILITTSNVIVPQRDVDSPGVLRKTLGLLRRPMMLVALLE